MMAPAALLLLVELLHCTLMLPLRNVSLPSTSCRSGEAMSIMAIFSGSSNGHACDRSGHAVNTYCVAKYGQWLGLGWTERAGVQLRSKAKIILINYLGALRSVYFFKKTTMGAKLKQILCI